MEHIRWKGELGDGRVHMTAKEYCEHKVSEDHERNRQILRKLSGNPILTDETRKAIRYAMFILDDNIWLRKQYMDQLEIVRAFQRIQSPTLISYDEMIEFNEWKREKAKKARNKQDEGI